MPHSIPETAILRKLGFDVPSPILEHYVWGYEPFKVQRETADLLTTNERAYVLNDMGTGKTKAALSSWDYLYGNKLAGKLLVIAPLSTLRFVWARECFATVPHRKVSVVHNHNREARLKRLAEEADIYLLNHDGIGVIFQELKARPDIDTLVIDELAVFRNDSQRTRFVRALARSKRWVWGMTGSPMPHAPTDVWAQCTIITPHTVPKYFSHLRHQLMTQAQMHVWVPKPDAEQTAYKCMQPAVRFRLDEVVELPPVVERTIEVELTPNQKQAYDKMAKEYHVQALNHTITAQNAGTAMNKLLQIAGGWCYAETSLGVQNVVVYDAKLRTTALVDAIEAATQKVIVLCAYRHTVNGLTRILHSKDIEHAIVHGDIVDRDSIFTAFQHTSKYRVLLAHPKCMSHGLTLTAADTVIWYQPMADLEVYEQTNARIRRVGQKHKQQILHFVATPVEKRIYSLLRSKQKVQDKFLAMFEGGDL